MLNGINSLIQIFILKTSFIAQASENKDNLNKASKIFSEITITKILQAVILLGIAYGGLWLINRFINWLSERVSLKYRLRIKQSLPFWRAFILLLVGIILINLFLNLSPNNILTLSGTVAVAMGFAFKDYVSSLIAGILALFESPYQVGDRVKIGDYYGEIVSYGLRGILIKTPEDNMVTIPHNKIWTEAISNANKGNVEAQTIVNFYFSHNIDIERVTKILYKVAYTSKYTQIRLPILVVIKEKPWGSHFKLKCYPIDARDEFIYQTDLISRAKKVFIKYNISYPSFPTELNEKID
jgi:small-conductance mechanosensitive channel